MAQSIELPDGEERPTEVAGNWRRSGRNTGAPSKRCMYAGERAEVKGTGEGSWNPFVPILCGVRCPVLAVHQGMQSRAISISYRGNISR